VRRTECALVAFLAADIGDCNWLMAQNELSPLARREGVVLSNDGGAAARKSTRFVSQRGYTSVVPYLFFNQYYNVNTNHLCSQ
jgi:hypothetical protein